VALLALIAAASVLAAYFAQDPLLAKWAAAASVVLLGIMIGFTLVLLIVLIAFNAGAGVALQKTPLYTGRFSEQFLHYAALARQYADKAVAPLIAVESWLHVPAKLMRRRNRKDA
jgi:hypothetical protein